MGLLVASIALLEAWKYRNVYRDRVTDPTLHEGTAPHGLYAPPEGLRPAEVAELFDATLTRSGSQTDRHLATMIDLQQRGHLAVRENGLGWRLSRGEGQPTESWEREWLDALVPDGSSTEFGDSYDKATSGRDSEARGVLATLRVLARDGLLHRPSVDRSGLLLPGLAVAAILLLGRWVDALETPTVVALCAVAVAWGLIRRRWREQRLPLTSEGRDLLRRARAFRRFLADADAERLDWAASQPDIGPTHPSVALLPYALALGMADSWYGRFGDLIPVAAAGAGAAGAAWWASQGSYRSFSSSRSSAVTAPSSSGSGGSFGGGGGGGGSGGGGGGSW